MMSLRKCLGQITFILIREVPQRYGPDHHSQKEDGARSFCQAFSITDEVPLRKTLLSLIPDSLYSKSPLKYKSELMDHYNIDVAAKQDSIVSSLGLTRLERALQSSSN